MNIKQYAGTLVLLSVVSADVLASAAHIDNSAATTASSRLLVESLEARMPSLPAYQRAQGAHPWVGPPRRSLELRAQAIATTQQVLDTHNERHLAGEKQYFLSWNALSDLSEDEYSSFLKSRVDGTSSIPKKRALHSVYTQLDHHYTGGNKQQVKDHHTKNISISFDDADKWDAAGSVTSENITDTTPLPKNWNWLDIEQGKYLTPIKNQGTCGSCWAFSAVSVIESRYAIDNKVAATPLSVEQVLSCSAPLDHIHSKFKEMVASSKGCEGGMPFLAFEYMSRVTPNGIACETDYPYVMATRVLETQCQSVASDKVAVAWQNGQSDYVAIASQNEDALMRAVYHGPVSSNIDALGDGFRHYGGGIYDASDCASDGKEVNHAVVVVGFGETEQGDKYWVIRNTWGTMWGENGYMRIARGSAGQPYGPCNMYLYSSYPTKLTKGISNSDGVCAAPLSAFEELGWAKLMGLDGIQWVLLLATSLLCVVAGGAFYFVTELSHTKKDAAGKMTYEDAFDRWVLPTKEQISAMLARRQPQTESV